ncbi:MAG: prolyl oligopeptidase family serine peptidase, partial [Clostridiales bacterium]|nr:prolyl oligopeptidase family serine peptidase [Clostridiales bacterium]
SSAGGHLAGMASNYFLKIEGEGADEIDSVDCRPNATISCYGVVAGPCDENMRNWLEEDLQGGDLENWPAVSSDKNVTANTPPAFLWNTSDDNVVNVIHTYRYAAALRDHGIPHEVHIFPRGAHGLGLAQDDPSVGQWGGLLLGWLGRTF